MNAHLPNRRPTHRAPGVLSPAERRKMYDAARPSPSRTYGRCWQPLRLAYLARNPLCQCEENDGAGCGRPAVVSIFGAKPAVGKDFCGFRLGQESKMLNPPRDGGP